MVATDYYATLGVRRDAGAEDIKRAYRGLARELHPDVNPDPRAQERFKEVTKAYEALSDPEKRQIVDLGGDPFGGAAAAGGSFAGGFGGLGDIMDAFFGTGMSRGPRSRVREGSDALIRIDIDLADAAFGLSRDLTVDTAVVCGVCTGEGSARGSHPETCPVCRGRGEVQQVSRSLLGQVMTSRPCTRCQASGIVISRPCPECGGDGRVRARRTLTVKIPAGIESGMRIRLSGEGEVGPGGGPPGDLYVEVVEREHPVFTRDGDDLHCEITLPLTAAALGTMLTLETLDGVEEVEVRPGTQPGTRLTLAARGVPHLRASGRGDLFVHVRVEVPTKLDERQEELLRELATLRGEGRAQTTGTANGHGLFGRLRDAFR